MIETDAASRKLPDDGGKVASFDPVRFYSDYAALVLARPGYPARAVFKSTLAFRMFGVRLFEEVARVGRYADVGGCFGFGANAMAALIATEQGEAPSTTVFELGEEFVRLGSQMFPRVRFVRADFAEWVEFEPFDLVTLFDVVEHVPDADRFLRRVAEASRYMILKTPLETGGDWRGGRAWFEPGASHPDGHVHFFTPANLERLLRTNGLDLLERQVLRTIVPAGLEEALLPESLGSLVARKARAVTLRERVAGLLQRRLPFRLARKYFGGGEHLCLCRSRVV